MILPTLPADWGPTLEGLHTYSKVAALPARAMANPHPKWWHISLTVEATGLRSDPFPLDGSTVADIGLDLTTRELTIGDSRGRASRLPLVGSSRSLGELLIDELQRRGAAADLDLDAHTDDGTPSLDARHVSAFLDAMVVVDQIFRTRRAEMEGSVGPIQLWTHHFDYAMEWFGTLEVPYEEDGEEKSYPSQLNVGFYPSDRAYFYSNPWPFSAELREVELPGPAEWHDGDWEGSILYYDEVAERDDGVDIVLDYLRAVYDAATPTLTAGTA